jgi:4-hydroxybenzoate polyprenyltransferase
MVLNDVFDLRTDLLERPERPIPSGRVSPKAARRLGWNLLMLGVMLGIGAAFFAGHARPGMVAALLAANIVLYDAWLKRTPGGPLAMGACRMLNVILGMSAMNSPLLAENWLVAGAIGVYIAGVTWFARREAQESRRLSLTGATLVMVLGIAMLAWLPHCSVRLVQLLRSQPQRWYLLTGALGALIVWRCFRAVISPTAARVRMAVAHCLLSLVMLDAVACYAVRDVPWACAILVLLLPVVALQRSIEMT